MQFNKLNLNWYYMEWYLNILFTLIHCCIESDWANLTIIMTLSKILHSKWVKLVRVYRIISSKIYQFQNQDLAKLLTCFYCPAQSVTAAVVGAVVGVMVIAGAAAVIVLLVLKLKQQPRKTPFTNYAREGEC